MRYRVLEHREGSGWVPAGLACEQGGELFRYFWGRILKLNTPLEDVTAADFPNRAWEPDEFRVGPILDWPDLERGRFLSAMDDILLRMLESAL